MMFKKLLVLVSALALFGCTTQGARISQTVATQFKEGISTEAEIVSALGTPMGISLSGGSRILIYRSTEPLPSSLILGIFYSSELKKQVSYEVNSSGTLHKITYSELSVPLKR
jgi:hypothetical protein